MAGSASSSQPASFPSARYLTPAQAACQAPSEKILAGLESKEAPFYLPKSRALEALELIGTPAARELLKRLGDGDAEARLTREARGARARLEAR